MAVSTHSANLAWIGTLAAILLVSAASSASASPQSSILAARPAGSDRKDLFKNLFVPAQPKQDPNRRVVPVPEQAPTPPQPSVRCGMPVIAADPSIDPKMVHRPPAGVHFTMRIISTPVCEPQSPNKPPNSVRPDPKK